MKKILIAGLLAVTSAGALFTPSVFAADDDDRTERRDHRRDDNDNKHPPRPEYDRNYDNDRDHDGDRDHTARDHRDGDHDGDRNRNRDHNDWNGPRPGNGVPPRSGNGGYIPPRPLPGNGNGYGRPGNSRPGNGYDYGRPSHYNGGYNGGYGGNYNGGGYGGYNGNGYGNQNLESIAKRIQSALRGDRQLSRYKLGTDTVRGTIELEGSVRSNSERQRAISIARDIGRGVQINGARLQVRY